MEEIWVPAVISAVLSAVIAGLVAAWTTQRKISIENITQDRRSWRDKIREKALSVHDAMISRDKRSLDRLRAEFRGHLNPNDKDDRAIIDCISLPEAGKELEKAEEFATRVALLLKHDWERVKLEAGPFILKIKLLHCLGCFFYKPKREEFSQNSNKN